ncbi:MAG: HAD hydrolase family protein [Elusimicrobiaceae bacterium]|nr:HAD hydrolase family protein [Elusimicrobiaceae bacterium]
MEQAQERARNIKLILTDVDGILTDGKVNFFLTQDGKIEEIKSFNTQDGIAAMLCHSAGIKLGIITGRRHATTVERAKNLGFTYMYQGFLTKIGPLEDVLEKEGISAQEVCYIGDDITDLPLLNEVGLAATVPNAVDVVKGHCHYVTKRVGGDGAFREIVDFILEAQGKLAPILEQVQASAWVHGDKPEMEIITSQEGLK